MVNEIIWLVGAVILGISAALGFAGVVLGLSYVAAVWAVKGLNHWLNIGRNIRIAQRWDANGRPGEIKSEGDK